jgi:hypothetical protein
MDALTFLHNLVSTANPLLPVPTLMQAVMPWAWAAVLAALWRAMTLRFGNRAIRLGGVVVILAICLLPAPWSPAHWLALAFQMPSLVLVLASVVFIAAPENAIERPGLLSVAAAGTVLGWLLLLDTLAMWPVSLYSFGFSALAVGVAALLMCLPWLIYGRPAALPSVIGLLAVALFVFTRLPSGNVWDSVLDPWLWVALQIGLLRAWRKQVKKT